MKLVISESLGIERDLVLEIAKSKLKDVEIDYYEELWSDNQELIRRCKDADLLVIANHRLDKEVIEACPNLKMISVAFTGVDHVDLVTTRNANITVCNCAGYSTVAVADLVFGLVINLYRRIRECDQVIRKEGTKNGLIGYELEGKTFGIIGTGAIGLRVAKIARAFGCKVLAYSRTVKDIEGIEYTDLDSLLKESDIVSIHIPLNESTKHLISKEKIALMKKSAILINTARGAIVDYVALADALNNNEIAGAGLDVYDSEPPLAKDNVILHAKNVLATPHIGFASKEALVKRAHIAFDNVAKYLEGHPQNLIK